MLKLTVKVFGFFSILVLAGCRWSDCRYNDPPIPFATIRIIDVDGNLLVGPKLKYHPDSIILHNESDTIALNFYDRDSSEFTFGYYNWIDNEEYYLQLESADIDTIAIESHIQEEKCYDYREIDTLYYNSRVIKLNYPYNIVK